MPDKTLPSYKWIKFWISSLDDIDFMSLDNATLGVFMKLYLYAGRGDAGGLLCIKGKLLTLDDLSWYLRITPEELESHINKLIEIGFLEKRELGYLVLSFMEQQGPSDEVQREKWREYQRKHRKNIDASFTYTDRNKEVNEDLDPESESDLEKDTEKDIEGELECHNDVNMTLPLTPEFDFGTFTATREMWIRGFCNVSQFSPKTTEKFLEEHMPSGVFEARLEREYSGNNSFAQSVSRDFIDRIEEFREQIYEVNYYNLCKTFEYTFDSSLTQEDLKYFVKVSETEMKYGENQLPLLLNISSCEKICRDYIEKSNPR